MTAKGSTPGKENPLDVGKLIAGILVTVLGGVLLKVSGDAIDRLEDKDSRTATATVTAPAAQSTQSLSGSTIRPSTTPGPRVFDFAACAAPCDGTNNEEVFPDGTKVIYSRWNYASIPAGADYVRTWTVNDLEWVRYDCVWQGPPAGMDEVELREPMGFHSGEWEISISIDGVVVFQRGLTIEGNNTYWDPAGAFDTCYGE
jgi:hypothetical protein